MGGDLVQRRVLLGQDSRDLGMGGSSGRGMKILIDCLMHQGMDEAHGVAGCEQVHRDQRVDGHTSGVEIHVRERGDTVQARLAAQDGDRPGHGNRLRRQPPQAQHRGLGHGPRPGLLDQNGRLPGGLDSIGLEGAEELPKQERNAARSRPTRFDERLLGAPQPCPHELPTPCMLSGVGQITRTPVPETNSASSEASTCGSPVRTATSSTTVIPSSRRER
jgi:hypothetical protein